MKNAILLAASLLAVGAFADYDNGTWKWRDNGDGKTATLTGYSGSQVDDLVLPAAVEANGTNYLVTAIGSSAFSGKSWFKTALIPDTIRIIGSRAFDDCRALKSIEVPGSVTNIGSYAFNGCTNLVTATLNEGIVSIGDSAFYNCSSLLVASVPNSVTNLGSGAYASCTALTNITIRGGWNPTQSWRFPSGAGNLDTIKIIGNGDLVIGEKTFGDSYNSSALMKERHLKISGVKSIANKHAFGYSPNLETVEFGDNALENIGNNSFDNCRALKSIEVPGSVTNIGSYAFNDCTNLVTATLNEGVVSIGDRAFYNCSSLLVASVPNSVTNLGSGAYASCTALTNITIRGGWNPTQSWRFPSGAGNLDTIKIIGNGDLVIGEKTFGDSYNSSALMKERHLKISGVKSIANEYAFGWSPNLETVEFGDNALENIGNSSFNNCPALKSIEVPGSVTNIGRYAFNGCTNLVTATLNEGLLTINNNAFEGCSSLLVASVPNSVTNLGSSAYASCNALTNITIRGGWNPTQSGRFPSGAANLDTIEIIGNGDLVIGDRTFGNHYDSGVLKERHLKISGVKSIANENAFGCSPNLETVEFGDNALENIGNSSFNKCPALKSIEVPGSVTNIGSYAFYGCANLATAVLMPTNAPMLGGSAFGDTKPVTVFVSEDAAGYDVAPWSNWNIRKTNADSSIGLSGSLTANATIDAHTPYAIMAPLTVKSGVKLTIESGARVKFYEGSSITVERGGEVVVKGTMDSPVSLVPSGDGVEWNGFTVNWDGRLQLEYVNIEGAGSRAKGAVKSDGYASLWGCCISGSDGIALDGGSVYATNTVIKSMGTAVASSAKLVNGVIEDCNVVNASGNIYNTIIKDCGPVTSGNFSYCLFDNTDYANFNHYANTSIAGDAKFIDGTFYRIAADSAAVDAGSGRYAPETDYFGRVRMASTKVAATGEPNGRGICPDIGIYEADGLVEVNLPELEVAGIGVSETNGTDVAALIPGHVYSFCYSVTNSGDGVASAPWVEQLWLTNETGLVRLQSWSAAGDIPADDAAQVRTFNLAIPDTIDLSGEVRLLVRLDTDRAVIQKDEVPHEGLGENAVHLSGVLTLSLSDAVKEGGATWGQVKRSGDKSEALDVTLSAAGDASGQVTNMPQMVTIGKNSASAGFFVRVEDDDAVNGDRVVTLSAAAGDFDPVSRQLTIVDDEVPQLALRVLGVTTNAFTEGTNLTVRVERPEAVTNKSVTVYLNGVNSSQFSYPSSVTLEAGMSYVDFMFASVDDTTSELAAALTLRASASGYSSATYGFTLEDDDIPEIELALSPNTVSEDSGLAAVYATVSRRNPDDAQLAKAVTVYLSADKENRVVLPASVTIPARTLATRFAVGVVDNAEQEEGDAWCDVTISAAIRIESCGCSWSPSDAGGQLQQTLRIIDDDGPALFVAVEPTTMREGVENAGTLTVRANTASVKSDIVVALSHDDIRDGEHTELHLPETVTIPAGSNSATAAVTTLSDDAEDGSQIVSIYAEAEGYAPGSTIVLVTDQNLPDFVPSRLEASDASIIAGETIEVDFDLANVGFLNRDGAIPYEIYWVKGTNAWTYAAGDRVATGLTETGVAAGETIRVVADVTAPEAAGNGRLAVVADPEGTITELDALNNTAWSEAVTVSPAYVTDGVRCGKAVYATGEAITVTGFAVKPDGKTRAANVEVEVYLLSGPMRRTVNVTTDGNGAFTATYVPLTSEIGHFRVGASYPGLNAVAVQDECDVAGFALTGLANARYVEDLTLGDVVTNANAQLRNPCGVPLTGVMAAATTPASCGLEIEGLPGTIGANEFVTLACVFTAENASPGKDYEKFAITLTSAEGATLTIPVYFYSQAKQAKLAATPASVSATMTRGRTRTVSFELTNLGYGEAVDVAVASPDVEWLRVAGGAEIASLANNQSATVTLELSPGADIELNRNFTGRLAVNGRNKGEADVQTFLTVPMTFMAVSEETGAVRIDCVDDATYNLESAPHLEGASVRITNPYTGEVVAEGTSGADGIFAADGIREGTYQLVVTAAKHGSYAAAIDVNPGRTTTVVAFLQYQAITANWTVTRTEIEDQYQVDLELEFETSVPVPVVKMDFIDEVPSIQPGESYATKAVFTNLGLIRADDVSLELPELYGYVWTYPSGSFSLAAGAARAVPVVLTRLSRATESDFAAYTNDVGHVGMTSAKVPHSEIYDRMNNLEMPTLADFIEALHGGTGMAIVQHHGRAGSGTSASGAGTEDDNPCKAYPAYEYKYECDGDKWVTASRQLVYKRNCPSSAAPSILPELTGAPSIEPSRYSGGIVNVPPGMNGGDFWVFEDGCNGGVSNKVLSCLKDLAKAGMDLELMMYGKVLKGFDGGVKVAEFCDNFNAEMKKISDFCDKIINGNLSPEEQLNIIAQVMERGKNLLKENGSEEGNPLYDKALTGANVFKALSGSWEEITSPNTSDGDRARKIIETAKEVVDTLPESVQESALGKLADHLNTIKEIDKKFDGVKKTCLPLMNGSGLPGSRFLLSAAPQTPAAEQVAGDGPKNIANLREGAFAYALDFEKAIANFLIEILGSDTVWQEAAYAELSTFLGACHDAIGDDGKLAAADVLAAKPSNVSDSQVETFVSRWNNMTTGQHGDDDPYADTGAAGLVRTDVLGAWLGRAEAANSYAANESGDDSFTIGRLFSSMMLKWLEDIEADAQADSAAVCARVSLKLSQTYTMTREAFEGTLTLYNGHESMTMTNVWLELQITNADGDNCNGLFEISAISCGTLEADGSNVVNVDSVVAKTEGTSIVRFVPAVAAAPETPVAYSFGGKVHYTDPFTGEAAAISLLPVTLEVNPMPQLYLDYFVQRDVYADNPFTKDIVEASMPAELAVLVRNEGYGDANKVTISSVQPEVVENEKGLMIDFRLSDYSLDKAVLNGAVAGLGLNDVELGTVAARSSTVAQWWLTSTLQGHFSGMRASVTHLNSQGIVDTSLIREVEVHPLIRSVDVGDVLPAFLAADNSKYGNPDRLYRADGEVLDVRSDATAAVLGGLSGQSCTLTVAADLPGSGPFYAKVALPGAEQYEVVGLTNESTGAALSPRNAWITDRTFVDGDDPKVETCLHIFDVSSSPGEKRYAVTLQAKPSDAPEVSGFEGVTADALVTNAVVSLDVLFSTAIDAATFSTGDVAIRYQGALTNVADVATIVQPDTSDATRYTINFSSPFAELEGHVIVQAFASGVTSLAGTLGKSMGRQIGWTHYVVEKPAVVSIKGWLDGATVNSVNNVTVQFAASIDPATFTTAAVKVDGRSPTGDSGVTITPSNKANTSFRITGLDGMLVAKRGPNDHTIEIDTAQIRNAAGVSGAARFTATVTIDENAPTAVLEDAGEEFGSHKWRLTFSKDVLASTVTTAAFTLNGAALPASAKIAQVSASQYILSGLDAAISADGTYTLAFDASQVADASGNTAVSGGATTVEWTRDNAAPELMADLAFAPDFGTNDTDGVTWRTDITVTGTVTARTRTLEILVADAAGEVTTLVEPFEVDEGAVLSLPVTLPSRGKGRLIVRAVNASGYSSDTEKDFYIDAIPLLAELRGFPEDALGKLTGDVQIVFSAAVTNLDADCFAVWQDGTNLVDLTSLALTPDETGTDWTLSGLDALTSGGGAYAFSLDLSKFAKLASGLHGEADSDCSANWYFEPPDTTPPELLGIYLDDVALYDADGDGVSVVSNGASSVKFVFSEPVNLSALKSSGWFKKALRLQLLGDSGAVTGEVAILSSQLRWRAAENAIVWMRGERALPVGNMRFLLDSGLIADLAGNALAGESGIAAFPHFSKPETLFIADGEYAAPANFDGALVVGVKKNGVGEAYHYGFGGEKGDVVVSGIEADKCLGVSVAKIGGDLYCGTYDGKVCRNGTHLEDVNIGRERAVLSVYGGRLVVGGDDGKLFMDGAAFRDGDGDDLVVDPSELKRSAAAFSDDWTYEGAPLLVSGRAKGGLALYAGDGFGRWNSSRPLTISGAASTNLYERSRPVAIDVDGDGTDDLVTGYADGTVTVRYVTVGKAFVCEFSALPFHTLEEALDTDELATNFMWRTPSAQPWLAQTGGAAYGDDYAISSGASAMEVVAVGPGTLSFRWKKSGVGGYSLSTNGVTAAECTASVWTDGALEIPGGICNVAFTVSGAAVGYADKVGWIDYEGETPAAEKLLRDEKAAYAEGFEDFMRTYGGVAEGASAEGYVSAMTNRTGAVLGNSKQTTLLQEFIAGTNPEDPDDVFRAEITVDNGDVIVTWTPDVNEGGRFSRRVYRKYGKKNLSDSLWTLVEDENAEAEDGGKYHFFTVEVDMR